MCLNKSQLVLLLLTIPHFMHAVPVSSPESSTKPAKTNILSTQQTKLNNVQDAQLNTLSVYATNYDAIENNPNQSDKFKPSYQLSEIEHNFTPIYNSNSIAPEYTASVAGPHHAPVLMQYLPQTINTGGVQYLQLIPSRPLMVPIGPYLNGNSGVQTMPYHQHLAPSNNIDYTSRPLLSTLPLNMPPPAPAAPLVNAPSSPLASYGIQSYAANILPYKQSHRINRETKDKQLLGPLSLNLNEYLPPHNSQQQYAHRI